MAVIACHGLSSPLSYSIDIKKVGYMFESLETAEAIRLSLTPIFLIVGIGQMLNAVTSRLARILDRGRWYEGRANDTDNTFSEYQINEIRSIKKRLFWANWSVNLLTFAALLICLNAIALLLQRIGPSFMEMFSLATFVLGLVSITGGLVCFLMEVSIATRSLKLRV